MLELAMICITVLFSVFLISKQMETFILHRNFYIYQLEKLKEQIGEGQTTIKAQMRKSLELQEYAMTARDEAVKLRDDVTKLLVSKGFNAK
jgi:hypothetical protein